MKPRTLWILLLLAWTLAPMFWQVLTSFTSDAGLVNETMPSGHYWTLDHYRTLLASDPPFWRYLANSALVGSVSTVLTVLLAIPCAYQLAKLGQRWRRVVKLLVMAAAPACRVPRDAPARPRRVHVLHGRRMSAAMVELKCVELLEEEGVRGSKGFCHLLPWSA